MSWSIRQSDFDTQRDYRFTEHGTADRTTPEITTKGQEHLFQIFSDQDWDSYLFAESADLEWFQDARYGLFLCYGICSIGKVDIGWPRYTRKAPDTGHGQVPDAVYDGWADTFNPKNFDARQWAALAKAGGMKYVVIIAKHHDGYHMWDTALSDHKITNSPFGRDYLKELTDACREAGLKIGIYFSQRDWYHPDYNPTELRGRHQDFITYLHSAVEELMTNYGKIDILWWDAVYWNGMFTEDMWRTREIERKVRQLQPHIIINNRGGAPGDYDTPEAKIGFYQDRRPWETCMPLGDAWAYTGTGCKDFDTVIRDFVRCACGNGNFLLSIGARADGTIAPEEEARIRQIGSWLKTFGESIYSTRGGPYMPAADYGTTQKKGAIYLHILNPDRRSVTLSRPDVPIRSVKSLNGGEVSLEEYDDCFTLTLGPGAEPDRIIKITLA